MQVNKELTMLLNWLMALLTHH